MSNKSRAFETDLLIENLATDLAEHSYIGDWPELTVKLLDLAESKEVGTVDRTATSEDARKRAMLEVCDELIKACEYRKKYGVWPTEFDLST